jgi:hypothetical protein
MAMATNAIIIRHGQPVTPAERNLLDFNIQSP